MLGGRAFGKNKKILKSHSNVSQSVSGNAEQFITVAALCKGKSVCTAQEFC